MDRMNFDLVFDFTSFPQLCSIVQHNPHYWSAVKEHLDPYMLDEPTQKRLWEIFDELANDDRICPDFVLAALTSEPVDRDWNVMCGDVVGGPVTANIQPWIDGVRNHYFEKTKKRVSDELARAAMDRNQERIDEATKKLAELEQSYQKAEEKADDLKELLSNTFEHLEDMLQREPGVTTGFDSLDRFIGGFHPGCFYIIAARPGVGKTAVALNFAAEAVKHGHDIAFFSLEMTQQQIGHRMIARISGVENRKMRNPQDLTDEDLDAIVYTSSVYSSYKGKFCVRCGGYSFADIEREVKFLKSNYNIKVVFVDYLTIVKVSAGHSREREVGELSSQFKRMALDLDIAVVCLAQPNREMEKQNRKPRNSDLRDSGQIEQDADLIMWVHREADDQGCLPPATSLLITKNRHGEIGMLDGFKFDARRQLLTTV